MQSPSISGSAWRRIKPPKQWPEPEPPAEPRAPIQNVVAFLAVTLPQELLQILKAEAKETVVDAVLEYWNDNRALWAYVASSHREHALESGRDVDAKVAEVFGALPANAPRICPRAEGRLHVRAWCHLYTDIPIAIADGILENRPPADLESFWAQHTGLLCAATIAGSNLGVSAEVAEAIAASLWNLWVEVIEGAPGWETVAGDALTKARADEVMYVEFSDGYASRDDTG